MAVYPCARGGHRYREAQQSVYFTRMNGAGVATMKLRLCPRHFEQTVDNITDKLAPIDETLPSSMVCEVCDLPKTETLFARVFGLHREEAQYCADLCAAHSQAAADACGMGDGEPMGGR